LINAMKSLNYYGSKETELVESARYEIRHGLTIPEKYLRLNIVNEKGLNEDLLKRDLDFIISKAPVKVLPFHRDINGLKVSVVRAEVDQFARKDDVAIPRTVDLHTNYSLEMIEPDLSYEGLVMVRALSTYVIVSFEIREDKFGFTPKDFVGVRIHRYVL